jgi:hypothetical protein
MPREAPVTSAVLFCCAILTSKVTIQSTSTAPDTSTKAARAQSISFCTVGAPLSPNRPDKFSVHLDGKPSSPRCHTCKRGEEGQKRRSRWIKLKKFCVETPNRALYALFCAISIERIGAPSIRLKALRLPPSSRIATFSLTSSSWAFAAAVDHFLCQLGRDTVFLHHVTHWPPPHLTCIAF